MKESECEVALLKKEKKKKRKDVRRMTCLPWLRLRRPSILGARPMIAGCLLMITASVIITLHAGICVGGMWRCGPEKPKPEGLGAIIQLRRDVATTLMRVAADIRSGNTAAAAAELEATAALLDSRYSSKVRGPPMMQPGAYIPPSLDSTSSPAIQMLADEQDETRMEHPLKRGSRRDLLVEKMRGVSSFQELSPENFQKNGRLGESIHSPIGNHTKSLSSSHSHLDKGNFTQFALPEAKSDKSKVLEEDSRSDKEKAEIFKLNNNLEFSNAVKSVYQMYMLPGEAELDLGDEPLPSIKSQITVLVDGCGSSPPYTVSVVRQAVAMWTGIAVIVAVDEEKRAEVDDISHHPGVNVLTVPCEKWRRVDLGLLLDHVTTPYSLVLDGTSAVTDDINLLRLLSILIGLRKLGVGVVGAAERGRDGFWDYTCTRLTLDNSRLRLRDGYEFSKAACLFCDVTSSSFLAETKILREVPFDVNMPHRSQMIDWGLQLQRKGILTMTCPDVMFHSQRNIRPRELHREVDRSCITKEDRKQARLMVWAIKRQYKKLIQKWEINIMIFNNGTTLEYDCREMRYDCNAYHKVKHYMLPPCCLKIKYKMFSTLNIIARENRVPYEINSGTLLGAVKFKDGLPWDFDDDAYYRNSDVEIFIRNKARMRRLGLSPYFSDQVNRVNSSIISKYIYSTSPGGFFMDLWGVNKMPSEGTLEALGKYPDNLVCLQHGHIPTTIKMAKNVLMNKTRTTKPGRPVPFTCFLSSMLKVGTNLVSGPWNPGKKALNRYGDNLYRHQGHWRWSSVENPGWRACPRPGHHTCLDIHPTDGSLPFL
ncbi:uncharacterized protein [Palaemon carinicauda]|uniref:uncharacterized protein n=1 Tax=Palaemon carinicauda TaxID=392227 RepID=UPI0035B648D8